MNPFISSEGFSRNEANTISNTIKDFCCAYEEPYKYYYIVFKPFNKHYSDEYDGMEHIRKYIQKRCKQYVITREITSAKIHYNVLAVSKYDLRQLNGNHTKRYMIYSSIVSSTIEDRYRVIDYITKEFKQRDPTDSDVNYYYRKE